MSGKQGKILQKAFQEQNRISEDHEDFKIKKQPVSFL